MDESEEDRLFEIYKLAVESADSISERRQQTNNYFLMVNSAIVGLSGFFANVHLGHNTIPWVAFLAVSGIIISYAWYRMIRSYRDLNTAKFKIIHELEASLPYALYTHEWALLGEGKDKKNYLRFTSVERVIPWIYVVLFAVILMWSLANSA